MGEPQDLQYINSVLSGAPGASGQPAHNSRGRGRSSHASNRRSASASGSDRGTGRGRGGTRSGSRTKVRGEPDQPAAAPSQPGGHLRSSSWSGAGPSTNAAAAADEAGDSRGGRRCELCACWVAGGAASWRTHVAGIQHRRQELSVRETGAPGRTIVSVFEADSGHAPAKWRPQQQAVAAAADAVPPAMAAQSQALRRELINYCTSTEYARWVESVSPPQLAKLFRRLHSKLPEQLKNGRLVVFVDAPLAVLPAAAAGLVINHLLVEWEVGQHLHPGDAAAVALLGSALHQLPHLTRLTVDLAEWLNIGGMALRMNACVERALCRLLQNAAAALSTGTHPLRNLCIELACCEESGKEPPERLVAAAADFMATLAAAACQRRQSLLMSLHPRSSSTGCLIGYLPTPLLAAIMAEGAPLAPCSVLVEAVMLDSSSFGEFTREILAQPTVPAAVV